MSPCCKISHARLTLSSPTEALLVGRHKSRFNKQGGNIPQARDAPFHHRLLHPQPRRPHAAIAPEHGSGTFARRALSLAAVTHPQPTLRIHELILAEQCKCRWGREEALLPEHPRRDSRRGLTTVNPLAGFCLLQQCPGPRDLFGKVALSILTPTPTFKTQERPRCSFKVAEWISLHVGVRMESLEQRGQPCSPPSGLLGHPGLGTPPWQPQLPRPAERSLLRGHRVPLVSGFYSRRKAESLCPHATHSAWPRTPRAGTGGVGTASLPPFFTLPPFALI